MKFIYEHYKLKLSLLDVAEQCFISSWHLSKLLNQYTGRGFFEIVNTIRIDKAKDLLENKNYKIQDVSETRRFSGCNTLLPYIQKLCRKISIGLQKLWRERKINAVL